MQYYFSGALSPYLRLVLFAPLKIKVIRVLFQLESPHSEHRNSSYVQNNSDYYMIKTEIRIWLDHGPTLSEFLNHLEQAFDNVYFHLVGSP